MSAPPSKRARRQPAQPAPLHDPDPGSYILPQTVSRPALLEDDSDRRFRMLVCDLFAVAARMELARDHFGRRLGVSGAQYSVLAAVAHFQGKHGIGVGALAQVLHVSSGFVTSETGKLARRNLLIKRVNPFDRRGVLLSVSPAGRLKLDRIAAEIRAVNDLFFGSLDREAFAALCRTMSGLVAGSDEAVRYIASMRGVPRSSLRRAV